jgi:two-component sensor histidine kinase
MSKSLIENGNLFSSEIDRTHLLTLRDPSSRDAAQESSSLQELLAASASNPDDLAARFAAAVMFLCGAQSAGFSLAENGGVAFSCLRWTGASGVAASATNRRLPTGTTPCAIALVQNEPILLARPERAYPDIAIDDAPLCEVLIVPLPVRPGVPTATLWVATHDESRAFTRTEAELLTRFADVAASCWSAASTMQANDEMLRQKDMLMREVNHRVANSLQLTSSTLRMQAHQEKNPHTRAEIEKAVLRIAAVRHLHQRLHSSGDMEYVEIADYLRDLCLDLTKSMSVDVQGGKLRVAFDCASALLPTDFVSKIGLIATELIINALKHGCAGDACSVVVGAEIAEGRIVLSVADGGPGLPGGFDINRTTGLGIRVVLSIASSLGGHVEARPGCEHGAMFIVDLPLPDGVPEPHPNSTAANAA